MVLYHKRDSSKIKFKNLTFQKVIQLVVRYYAGISGQYSLVYSQCSAVERGISCGFQPHLWTFTLISFFFTSTEACCVLGVWLIGPDKAADMQIVDFSGKTQRKCLFTLLLLCSATRSRSSWPHAWSPNTMFLFAAFMSSPPPPPPASFRASTSTLSSPFFFVPHK